MSWEMKRIGEVCDVFPTSAPMNLKGSNTVKRDCLVKLNQIFQYVHLYFAIFSEYIIINTWQPQN